MSLDVYLITDVIICREDSGIFIRRDGEMVEISRAEWDEMCPGHEPTIRDEVTAQRSVYDGNITHNLSDMAEAAGIYKHLWRPEELGITKAAELIEPLTAGLALLKSDPARFKVFNSPNGWGKYEHFVPFVEEYLSACREHPEATVRACC